MNKILVLVDKRQAGNESYQVLVNQNYISGEYLGEQKHETFLEETSEEFAKYIAKMGVEGQVCIFNGLRINKSGQHEKLVRLEETIAERFGKLLRDSLIKFAHWGNAVPIAAAN